MVVGHPGEPGLDALWRVAVEIESDGGHVPILLHNGVASIAEERIRSPSHATWTVVQVRRA